MTNHIESIPSEQLFAELARRSAEAAATADAEREAKRAKREAIAAERRAARAAVERARKIQKHADDLVAVERRAVEEKRAEKVAALVEQRHQARALWNLPEFAALATSAVEFDGRSGQDDADEITAFAFSAVEYAQGLTGPTGRPSLKLAAAQAVNASRMIGEADESGEWQPTFHVETRRDGSTFRRYVTEQMHQVSEVHQLDGGDRIIVAVEVAGAFHVMHCAKRWLDMSKASSVSLFGKIYPNRNIPRTGRRFFFEPIAYIRTEHAVEAEDMAWRWASEDRLTADDNEQHAEPSVEPLAREIVERPSMIPPHILAEFHRAEAEARRRESASA